MTESGVPRGYGTSAESSLHTSPSESSISKTDYSYHASETSPLLEPQSPVGGEVADPVASSSHARSPRFIVAWLIVAVIFITLGDQVSEAPRMRIFESIYCYQYWEEVDPSKLLVGRAGVGPGAIGGVEEILCKLPKIQSQVAKIAGYQTMIDGFPSLFLSIPYSIAADRIGRRPILLMGFWSFPLRQAWILIVAWNWQTFDLRLSWLSSIFSVMGGGSAVVSALTMVVISDVTDDNTRATAMLRVAASNLVMYFIAPPLAAWLMRINPWIPSILAVVAFCLTAVIMLMIPETLNYRHHDRQASKMDTFDPMPVQARQSETAPLATPGRFLARLLATTRDNTSFMTKDWRVIVLVLPFIVYILAAASNPILLQYINVRYEMPFWKSSLILSTKAGLMVFVLLALIPWISTYLTARLGLSGRQKDLYLARASLVVVCIGWFLAALAPTIGLFIVALLISALGAGVAALIRSFMATLVRPCDVAKVYTVISLVETVALMLGAPLIAKLFEVGLNRGGASVALPLWFVGAFYTLISGLVFLVRIRDKDGQLERPLSADDAGQRGV